jgi:hypothetical protein
LLYYFNLLNNDDDDNNNNNSNNNNNNNSNNNFFFNIFFKTYVNYPQVATSNSGKLDLTQGYWQPLGENVAESVVLGLVIVFVYLISSLVRLNKSHRPRRRKRKKPLICVRQYLLQICEDRFLAASESKVCQIMMILESDYDDLFWLVLRG